MLQACRPSPPQVKLEAMETSSPEERSAKPRRGLKRRRAAGSVSPSVSAAAGGGPNGLNGLVKTELASAGKSPTRKRKRRGAGSTAGSGVAASEDSSEERSEKSLSLGLDNGPWRPESILQAPPNCESSLSIPGKQLCCS